MVPHFLEHSVHLTIQEPPCVENAENYNAHKQFEINDTRQVNLLQSESTTAQQQSKPLRQFPPLFHWPLGQ